MYVMVGICLKIEFLLRTNLKYSTLDHLKKLSSKVQ